MTTRSQRNRWAREPRLAYNGFPKISLSAQAEIIDRFLLGETVEQIALKQPECPTCQRWIHEGDVEQTLRDFITELLKITKLKR